MKPYAEIVDAAIWPMSDVERYEVARLLDQPHEDFKLLVEVLNDEGCPAPKQQAALMLLNSRGAAMHLLAPYRKPPLDPS